MPESVNWQTVAPEDRTEEHQIESFDELDDLLMGLNLGSAFWDAENDTHIGFVNLNIHSFAYHRPINEEIFTAASIETAIDNISSELNESIHGVDFEQTPKATETLMRTIDAGNELFRSEFFNPDILDDASKDRWNRWCIRVEAESEIEVRNPEEFVKRMADFEILGNVINAFNLTPLTVDSPYYDYAVDAIHDYAADFNSKLENMDVSELDVSTRLQFRGARDTFGAEFIAQLSSKAMSKLNDIADIPWQDLEMSQWSPVQRFDAEASIDSFLYNLKLGSAQVTNDNILRVTINTEHGSTTHDYSSVYEMMYDCRSTINNAIAKINVNDIFDLNSLVEDGNKIFDGFLKKENNLTDENLKKWNGFEKITQNAYRFASQLNETFQYAGIYEEFKPHHGSGTDFVGFKAVDEGGKIILSHNGAELYDDDCNLLKFSNANEAFNYLKENYKEDFQTVSLNIVPFEARTWTDVPPKYRSTEQIADSFRALDRMLTGLHIGKADKIPYETNYYISYYDKKSKYGRTIEASSVEEAFTMDNGRLANSIDYVLSNMSEDELKDCASNGTINKINEVFSSAFIDLDWMSASAKDNNYYMARIHLNSVSKGVMPMTRNEIGKISTLMDYIGVNPTIGTEEESKSTYIKLINKDDGSVFCDDPNIKTAKNALEASSSRFDEIFLNGKLCCNYFENFNNNHGKTIEEKRSANYTQAFYTAKALNCDTVADVIGKYMDISQIPLGDRPDVPFMRDETSDIECGLNKNGFLYVKDGHGNISNAWDMPENRIKMAGEYKRTVDEWKNKNNLSSQKNNINQSAPER